MKRGSATDASSASGPLSSEERPSKAKDVGQPRTSKESNVGIDHEHSLGATQRKPENQEKERTRTTPRAKPPQPTQSRRTENREGDYTEKA